MGMSALTADQKALFAGKTWHLVAHLKMSNGSSYVYECAALRISKVVVNERIKGKYTRKEIYSIAGDDREFADLPSLADALLARNAKLKAKGA
jgi:hypothetical protein